MTSYINRVCACARHACAAAYLCCRRCSVERQSARSGANAVRSLPGRRTSLRWGSCTLQHKQAISRSSAPVATANPGASLRATTQQHPHSFRKWMLFSLGFYNQRNEIFKSLALPCISPKYCCAHLLSGDSDDSIKHMNEGNCHVDLAKHWRLMILNQGGAPLTGTLGIPGDDFKY